MTNLVLFLVYGLVEKRTKRFVRFSVAKEKRFVMNVFTIKLMKLRCLKVGDGEGTEWDTG